jgi:uncharacterized protein
MPAQESEYRKPVIQQHVLDSKAVGQRFLVKVWQPIRRADDSERFPVWYATDSDEFFPGLANMAAELQLVGDTPRFILVGIGYENSADAEMLRMRDLFPRSARHHFRRTVEQLASSALAGDLRDVTAITDTTDASDFLCFVHDELMPFIAKHYPIDPQDNSYYGYSAGGTFGLHTLFSRPETFARYILGSPATSYAGNHFGMELARAFIRSGRRLDAQVYLSAGELEEFYGKFDLVSGYYLMAKFLKESAIPGLDLRLRLFTDETHSTSWTLAFTHGLKTLLGRANATPWWPEFD